MSAKTVAEGALRALRALEALALTEKLGALAIATTLVQVEINVSAQKRPKEVEDE